MEMLPKSLLVALAASFALLVLPSASSALPVTTDLSAETSEPGESPGTPASVLDATVTVELDGANLKITIDNTSDYDISEVWLNITGVTVDGVIPAAGVDSGFDLAAPPPEMVDGFGTFTTGFVVSGDVNVNDDLITAGETGVMVFLTCAGGDCAGAELENNAGTPEHGPLAVAAKFINGGNQFGDENDSAFGGSPVGFVIPEAGSLLLLGSGVVGLFLRGRRRS